MKLDKKIKKIVDRMVKTSFDKVGDVDELRVKEYVRLLSKLNNSQAIASLTEYLKRIKSEISKTTLVVDAPQSLSPAQLKEVRTLFADKYRVNQISTRVDNSLFGGVRVKLGDTVFDDTVRRKIEQLKGVIES